MWLLSLPVRNQFVPEAEGYGLTGSSYSAPPSHFRDFDFCYLLDLMFALSALVSQDGVIGATALC